MKILNYIRKIILVIEITSNNISNLDKHHEYEN